MLVVVLLAVLLANVFLRSNAGTTRDDVAAGARRFADDHGVIAEVGLRSIRLEDGRRFDLVRPAVVVSTYDLQPVAPRPGLFVHFGLEGGRVDWMAVIGVVARADPPTVAYAAELAEITQDHLVFRDGTVLLRPEGLELLPGFVTVVIDPATGRVLRASQDLVGGPSDG